MPNPKTMPSGAAARALRNVLCLDDFEAAAKAHLPHSLFATFYVRKAVTVTSLSVTMGVIQLLQIPAHRSAQSEIH
jgi:hypothetical protein